MKTVLNYLSETNGELHFFLHNYISENPLPLAGDSDADEWLVALASSPLTSVQDPRRSSVPSVAAAAAVTQGMREVSPRYAVAVSAPAPGTRAQTPAALFAALLMLIVCRNI